MPEDPAKKIFTSSLEPNGADHDRRVASRQPGVSGDEILEQLPYYLSGKDVVTVDMTRNTCYIGESSNKVGLYNLSVKKIQEGYQGVVRGSTWNGCCIENISPPFSYCYYIVLNDSGGVENLERLTLDYDRLNNCMSYYNGVHANGIEDPRLFMFEGEEWVIASCLGSSEQPHPCINAMCLFKISDPNNTLRIITPPMGTDVLQRQKNWAPFEWKGRLLCEYSICPHIILEIDPNTGVSEELYNTGSCNTNISEDASLRGGTPPIHLTHDGKSFYIALGHIRTGETSDYFHFFYTFQDKPPFSVTGMSKYFKLDGLERIQFAAELSSYEDMLYISYGVDDCYNRISSHRITDVMALL